MYLSSSSYLKECYDFYTVPFGIVDNRTRVITEIQAIAKYCEITDTHQLQWIVTSPYKVKINSWGGGMAYCFWL